ncbi:MAG: hypothetical protein R3E66_13580 [bacterium]
MDFAAQIKTCWADHGTDPAGVEQRLRELLPHASNSQERVWSDLDTRRQV